MMTCSDDIRVSCAGLALLSPRPGHVVFVQALRSRSPLLVPLGGVYLAPATVGRRFGRFEKPPVGGVGELRLRVRASCIERFRDWFQARQERETAPHRELVEELVEESRLLPSLAPAAIECTLLAAVSSQGMAAGGLGGPTPTLRFFELFAAHLPAAANRIICSRVEQRPRHAALVTEEEIVAGRTRSGVPCAPHGALLAPFVGGKATADA